MPTAVENGRGSATRCSASHGSSTLPGDRRQHAGAVRGFAVGADPAAMLHRGASAPRASSTTSRPGSPDTRATSPTPQAEWSRPAEARGERDPAQAEAPRWRVGGERGGPR